MDIFKDTTFTWWQISVFKLAMACFGIAVGAYWADAFLPYLRTLVVVGLVAGIYITYVYFKQR